MQLKTAYLMYIFSVVEIFSSLDKIYCSGFTILEWMVVKCFCYCFYYLTVAPAIITISSICCNIYLPAQGEQEGNSIFIQMWRFVGLSSILWPIPKTLGSCGWCAIYLTISFSIYHIVQSF